MEAGVPGVGLALGGVGKVALDWRWESGVGLMGCMLGCHSGRWKRRWKMLWFVPSGAQGAYIQKNVHFGPPPGVGLALAGVGKVALARRWNKGPPHRAPSFQFLKMALGWRWLPLEKCRWPAVGHL